MASPSTSRKGDALALATLIVLTMMAVSTTVAATGPAVMAFSQRTQPADSSCNCVAKTTALLNLSPCGHAVEVLTPGQRYRTVAADVAAPKVACGLRWVALRVRGDVFWTSARQLGGTCDCPNWWHQWRRLLLADKETRHPAPSGPSAKLIFCLCVIESNCRRDIGCRMDVGSLSCGPYQIKEAYWKDGGRLGGGWKNCTTGLNNMACSEKTVNNYVTRYGKHCVGAGRDPTDEDYARIHNGGPTGCRKASTLGYWNKVHACMEKKQ